jgi:hypothetical protein
VARGATIPSSTSTRWAARLSGGEAAREPELREAHRLFLEIGAPIRAEQVAKELGLVIRPYYVSQKPRHRPGDEWPTLNPRLALKPSCAIRVPYAADFNVRLVR